MEIKPEQTEVVDGVYRFCSTTDAKPFKGYRYLSRRTNGEWELSRNGNVWRDVTWAAGVGDLCVRDGTFVPYDAKPQMPEPATAAPTPECTPSGYLVFVITGTVMEFQWQK